MQETPLSRLYQQAEQLRVDAKILLASATALHRAAGEIKRAAIALATQNTTPEAK